VVGFLVNILPVPSTRDHRRTFRAAVGDADRSVSDAYAYQAMPIEHLVPVTFPALPRTALPIDTFFAAYRDVFSHPLSMPSVTVGSSPPIPMKDAEFALMMTVSESRTGAISTLSYGAWAFSESDARTLAAAYVDLLDRCTAQPDRPLGEVAATAGRAW